MLTHDDVGKLLAADSEGLPVLSLYVEIPQCLPELRGMSERVRTLLAAAATTTEGQVSPHAVAEAERDVRKILQTVGRSCLGHGAGVFLCRPVGLAEHVLLPAGLGERAVFATRPHVRPLLTALQRWPRYRVAAVARQSAWLFAVAGEHVGVAGRRPSGSGRHRTDPDGWEWLGPRRADERIGRLPSLSFRDAADVLNGGGEEEQLVIGGYPGAIPDFLAALQSGLRDRFAGSFAVDPPMVTPSRIRDLADPVVRHSVDRSQHELLAQAQDWISEGRAVAGLADSLAAVNRDSAAVLAIPGSGTIPGYACRRCGTLSPTGTGCPCGSAEVRRVPDLIEEMAAVVIRSGGKVQTVDGLPGGTAVCLGSSAAGRS